MYILMDYHYEMIIMTFIPHRDTVSVARLADLAAPIQLKVNQVDSDNNHN